MPLFAQTGQTRPRRVETNPDNRTETRNDEQNDNQKRRPVLQDRQSKSTSNNQTENTEQTIEDDDEVIKVDTTLVTIPVSVVDRDGRFIGGLRQQDFQIYENGTLQEIAYFATVEQPFTVVLMIDVSNSTRFKIEEIQDAAISFVNQLRREDKVMVISFDEEVHILSRPTNDRYALQNAIRRADLGQGTSLYEAVDDVINRELRDIEGRKAIVLFSDGVDTTSKYVSGYDNLVDAQEVDALIYPIQYDTRDGNVSNGGGNSVPPIFRFPVPGRKNRFPFPFPRGGGGGNQTPMTTDAEYRRAQQYLKDLAERTGGRFYEAGTIKNLDAAFSGIASELRQQYSLGFYPPNTGKTGEVRQIKVRVNRPNAVVKTRNSYIVGQENSNAKQNQKFGW